MPLEPGQALSHYRLIEKIGKGGLAGRGNWLVLGGLLVPVLYLLVSRYLT